MLLPGRAQVHVGVDEGGEQVAPLPRDDLGVGGRLERAGRPERGDDAVADEDVLRRVVARARVEDVRAPHEQRRRRHRRADERVDASSRSCQLGLRRGLGRARVPARTS